MLDQHTNYTFGIDCSSSTVDVVLPIISDLTSLVGDRQINIIIKDSECNSFTNRIRVLPGATTDFIVSTVAGATYFDINADGGSINLSASETNNKWLLT